MIARHAKNLRVTANARAKYLSTHYLELVSACEGAIVKKKQQLDKIKAEIVTGSNTAFLNPDALKKKRQQAQQLRLSLPQMNNRLQRLKSAAKKNKHLSDSELPTMCFGGRKLAGSVHRLDEENSAYKSKASWSKASVWTSLKRRLSCGMNLRVKTARHVSKELLAFRRSRIKS